MAKPDNKTQVLIPDKKFCFTVMPFSSDFNNVYECGIKAACKASGVYCERVDESLYQGTIIERIYNQIKKADLIIADMTGKNANVTYEIGYAHALNKRVILLTQDISDLPFDLKSYPHLIYDATNIKSLEKKLQKMIKTILSQSGLNINKIALELYYIGHNISTGNQEITLPYLSSTISIDIFNEDIIVYEQGDFDIAIITNDPYQIRTNYLVFEDMVALHERGYIYTFPQPRKLLPNTHDSINFVIDNNGKEIIDMKIEAVLRVFTSIGYRDYPITIKIEN